MPISTVSGHSGALWLGKLGAADVACLAGRVHCYEGHPAERVVFGVRLLSRLGCPVVLLSNAAGGVDPALTPGSLMLITDHLNLTGQNPLLGEPTLGPRFVDLSQAYDPGLQADARHLAEDLGILLHAGTYAGLLGPSYETPAEVRMLRTLGASAVGMSTVLEVIALRQLSVRVGAISCITNAAAGVSVHPLSHDEVQLVADQASQQFVPLMEAWANAAWADTCASQK
jgi:purine-nucleoside phosphorylase